MLIPKSYYNFIFDDLSHKKILLCLPYGNVGDQLIWQSCYQLLNYNNIEYDTIKNDKSIEDIVDTLNLEPYDAILWMGGGNMGTLYRNNYTFRKLLEKQNELYNKLFIVLPQSWTSEDDLLANTYYAREFYSIKLYESRAIFSHDLALAYELKSNIKPLLYDTNHKQSVGYFFRNDIEKL